MTTETPKPASPDFAAMATEFRLSLDDGEEYETDAELDAAYDKAVVGLIALSHAAGRAEGLAAAAAASGAFRDGNPDAIDSVATTAKRIERHIRALASAPVAGDQVAEPYMEAIGAGCYPLDDAPSPAPGLAAQEVERLRAIEAAAENLSNFAWSAVTANCTEAHVYLGGLINELRIALSAPRPEGLTS